MNPKVIGFFILIFLVSGATFLLTHEYDETHTITADTMSAGS